MRDKALRSRCNALPLLRRHRHMTAPTGLTELHFNKHQQRAFARHNVNLAQTPAQIAGENLIALGTQINRGDKLSAATAPLGLLAFLAGYYLYPLFAIRGAERDGK